jgi:Flp pilus assembly protein TadG
MGTRGEGGSMALELAIVTPGLLALLLLVAAAGRVTSAKNDVTAAAAQAAKAGALRQAPSDAADDAKSVARANLAQSGVRCPPRPDQVAVDVSDLRPGGRVVVTVTCRVSLGDLILLGVPGTKSLVSRSVAVVDVNRS